MVTDTARPPQTHRQDRLQYTAPLAGAQCMTRVVSYNCLCDAAVMVGRRNALLQASLLLRSYRDSSSRLMPRERTTSTAANSAVTAFGLLRDLEAFPQNFVARGRCGGAGTRQHRFGDRAAAGDPFRTLGVLRRPRHLLPMLGGFPVGAGGVRRRHFSTGLYDNLDDVAARTG